MTTHRRPRKEENEFNFSKIPTTKEIKQAVATLKPIFFIGKNGINEEFLDMVDKYLIAHQIIKVKSNNCENRKEVEKEAIVCSEKLNAEIIEKKGFTFSLFRSN